MLILDAIKTVGNSYQISSKTGAVAANASTKILFYAQNTSTTKLALVQNVLINGVYATTAYAVGAMLYELYIARAFTAEAGTPHGTALTISGANQRLKSSFDSTAFGVIRIADTTSTGIAAGTWTLDTQPVGQLASHSSAGTNAATPIIGSQYLPNNGVLFEANPADSESPIILGASEGIVLQATVPATGVAVFGVTMQWAEIPYVI